MWQVIESAATFVQGIIYFWFLSRLLDSKYDRRTTDILVIVMAVINVLVDACLSKVLGKNSIFMFMGIAFLYVILNFKNTIWDKISSFIAIEMIVAFVSQFLVYTFSFFSYVNPIDLIKQKRFDKTKEFSKSGYSNFSTSFKLAYCKKCIVYSEILW